jgi:hypothetical protein
MVLTVYLVLFPVIGLCCHRRLADTGVSGLLGLTSPLRDLTPTIEASEPHDFAVRLSASRQKRIRVHRIPALRS